jgi:hypothetical protein
MSALGGAERQLATHVKAAMRHGVAASEIVALREHVSVYAGMRRALKALAVVDHALAEARVARQPTLKKVRLADHETIVASAGDIGPAVVLVHALGWTGRMWEAVMAGLAQGPQDLRLRYPRPRPGQPRPAPTAERYHTPEAHRSSRGPCAVNCMCRAGSPPHFFARTDPF